MRPRPSTVETRRPRRVFFLFTVPPLPRRSRRSSIGPAASCPPSGQTGPPARKNLAVTKPHWPHATVSLHGQLAHLTPFGKQPVLFLTVCTAQRAPLLANKEAHEILRDIWRESLPRQGWAVGDYVLMPDHVHLFARQASDGCSLAKWMQAWKSISARRITTTAGIKPPLWQKDYFDRFLRSADSYSEKWDYVRMNPVRAGLAAAPGEWPYSGRIHALTF